MLDWDDPDFDPNKVDVAAWRSNLAKLATFLGRNETKAAG